MKIVKTIGCLALLCVIICGCIAMAKRGDAATATPNETPVGEANATPQPDSPGEGKEGEITGSVTVPKKYSEGLKFRSNGDGTCALAGMGSCTASCVLIPPQSPAGDTVTEILPYALKDSIVGAIELPTTIVTLSAASFAGCNRLAYVRVSAGNPAFAEEDGVLYTADGTTLIYCPSGRSATSLTLSARLCRIAAGAFADCTTLKTVSFAGTTSEWHNVIVGDDNDPLYAATLRFGT